MFILYVGFKKRSKLLLEILKASEESYEEEIRVINEKNKRKEEHDKKVREEYDRLLRELYYKRSKDLEEISKKEKRRLKLYVDMFYEKDKQRLKEILEGKYGLKNVL